MGKTLVFQTDFGAGGGGAMAGVVKSVSEDLAVYDFTHSIEPYNIRQAAYELSTVVPYWPAGTIFVSVVDPGVGTERRACVALLDNGSYVVTPDNGTLTMVADQIVEVRAIDVDRNRLPGSENVHIFHGRDVFAYNAARLAAGVVSYEELGPSYSPSEVVRLELTRVSAHLGPGWAEGGIYNFDVPYGSARINVRNNAFQQVAGFAYGDRIQVTVTDGDRLVYQGEVIYVRTFGDADACDCDASLVGDIQPGDQQMLRLNARGGFLQKHTPEVLADLSRAASYKVRFDRL